MLLLWLEDSETCKTFYNSLSIKKPEFLGMVQNDYRAIWYICQALQTYNVTLTLIKPSLKC